MSLTLRVKELLSSEKSLGWDWEVKNLLEDLGVYITSHKDSEERHERLLVEAYQKHKVLLMVALQEYRYE